MKVGNVHLSETVVVGLVVILQGAGSAAAKAIWNANWGLLAVAERWTPIPAWVGLAVAGVGVLIVLVGLRSSRAAR